jgi:hypothetical protein
MRSPRSSTTSSAKGNSGCDVAVDDEPGGRGGVSCEEGERVAMPGGGQGSSKCGRSPNRSGLTGGNGRGRVLSRRSAVSAIEPGRVHNFGRGPLPDARASAPGRARPSGARRGQSRSRASEAQRLHRSPRAALEPRMAGFCDLWGQWPQRRVPRQRSRRGAGMTRRLRSGCLWM